MKNKPLTEKEKIMITDALYYACSGTNTKEKEQELIDLRERIIKAVNLNLEVEK